MIPSSLYQTVYERLINLLILPKPYSAVALSTLRRIKMEMITPGVMHIEKSATHNEVLYEAVK